MQNLVTTGKAGRMLGVSRERVHALLREGRLSVVATDGWGRRLLDAEEVERFVKQRRSKRRNKGAATGE